MRIMKLKRETYKSGENGDDEFVTKAIEQEVINERIRLDLAEQEFQ